MDVRKMLPKRITNDELKQRGGSYTGTVSEIDWKETWNKYDRKKTEQLHLTFPDGYTLIPNISMIRTLKDKFGYESDDWIGMKITVRLKKFTFIDKKTGEEKVRWEKYISDCCDPEDASS